MRLFQNLSELNPHLMELQKVEIDFQAPEDSPTLNTVLFHYFPRMYISLHITNVILYTCV